MNDRNTHIMKAHLAAVSKLLLGKSVLKPGVSITAGDPLDELQRFDLGRMAAEAQTDVIHLEFATNDGGSFGMVGICVFVPRDQICYMFSDCCLWLGQGKSRAMILPRPAVRGHFRIGPGELIHVDDKPGGAPEDGVVRAHRRMRQLINQAPCVKRQVRIDEIPARQ